MKKEDVLKVVLMAGVVITIASAAYIFSKPPATPIKKTTPEGEEDNTSSEYLGGGGYEPAKETASEGEEGGVAVEPVPSLEKRSLSFDLWAPVLLLAVLSALLVPLALSIISSRRTLSDGLREDILAYLSVFPGANPRELCNEFQLSPSAINHHIRMLERRGEVYMFKTQKHIYIFPTHTSYTEAKKMAETMEAIGELNEKVRTVLEAILEGARTQNEIAQRTSLPSSTISYVMKKLVAAEIVKPGKENGRTVYFPNYENIYRIPRLGGPHITSLPLRGPPEGDLKVS